MVGQLPPARPVNQDDRNDLLIPLVSGVQELLFAPVNPFNNRPAFVAGPPPETGLAQTVQSLTRLNCRLWATRDKSSYSSRVNQYNGEVCGPYLASLSEVPSDGFIGLPFDGGQCDAVYTVRYTLNRDNAEATTGVLQCRGPVRGIIQKPTGTGSFGVFLQCNGVNISGSPNCRSVANTGAADYFLGGTGPTGGGGPTINSVVPCGLNNCGNPPPVVQPPRTVTPTNPIVPTIEIDLPGVGPITVNIDLDPTGRPVIFAPEVGVSLTVDPTFGGGGDDGDGGGGPPPGDVGSPGSGGTAGAGGDAEGEAPPGSVLAGLKLNLLTIPANAKEYFPGVYRGVCYVYMGTNQGLDHDPAGAMVEDGQFVLAEKDNLTRWRVSANNGYEVFVVPYYREGS